MRIIITKNGNTIIKELDNVPLTVYRNIAKSPRISSFHNKYFPNINQSKKNFSRTLYKNNSSNSTDNLFKKKFQKTKTRNFYSSFKSFDIEEDKFSLDDIKKAKNISLMKTKTLFPKNFLEKYEKNIGYEEKSGDKLIGSTGNIFGSMEAIGNGGITSFDYNSDGEGASRNGLFSFRQIIPKKTINKMKLKIIKDRIEKDKAKRITENDFRSEYVTEDEIQKFNKLLSYPKVNKNKSSLIKYLNEKELSPIALKNLYMKDNNKINHINKLCHMLLGRQEDEKFNNGIIKDKLSDRLTEKKKDFQFKMNAISTDIKKLKINLNKYEKKFNEKDIYKDLLGDYVFGCWKKYDLQRFNKKSTPKTKYDTSTFFSSQEM